MVDNSLTSLTVWASVKVFIDLTAGGETSGAFLTDTGLNAVGRVVVVGLGACLDAARAYDGVVFLELAVLKLKLVVGRLATLSICLSDLDI